MDSGATISNFFTTDANANVINVQPTSMPLHMYTFQMENAYIQVTQAKWTFCNYQKKQGRATSYLE
jgi:hypothetical protein